MKRILFQFRSLATSTCSLPFALTPQDSELSILQRSVVEPVHFSTAEEHKLHMAVRSLKNRIASIIAFLFLSTATVTDRHEDRSVRKFKHHVIAKELQKVIALIAALFALPVNAVVNRDVCRSYIKRMDAECNTIAYYRNETGKYFKYGKNFQIPGQAL